MSELVTPKEASALLGISTATITRCRKHGAPVHPWGSTGRCYRISVSEFVDWMERQGETPEEPARQQRTDVQAMAFARRMHVSRLGVNERSKKNDPF